MSARADAERLLRALGPKPDDQIPIGEAALALALLDCGDIDPAPYRAHLQEIADEAGETAGAQTSLAARIDALNRTIAGRHGYRGDRDSYDDLANANLIKVIDRRRGFPVALGILYLHAAQANGWRATGLNFPSHFVIALDQELRSTVIDPFNGGRECDEAALMALIGGQKLRREFVSPSSTRDVLIRLQNNIKSRHLQAGRLDQALAALDSMLLFAPDRADLLREIAQIGRLRGPLN